MHMLETHQLAVQLIHAALGFLCRPHLHKAHLHASTHNTAFQPHSLQTCEVGEAGLNKERSCGLPHVAHKQLSLAP